jgi:arsenite-transporting ATPase
MPSLVHAWVKALMAILLKYQPLVGIGDLGAVLLRLSRGLGRLRTIMSDGERTRFVAVTRAAALPRAETVRLIARLHASSLCVPIVVVNAAGAGTCSRCRGERAMQGKEIAALRTALRRTRSAHPEIVIAPAQVPPPHGCRALHRWRGTWRRHSAR